MVIRAADRVSDVLNRDERMVERFASAAPAFERLRSPVLRRTMARLVTVEQAARIAGVEPADLVAYLNEALDGAEVSVPVSSTGPRDAAPSPEIADMSTLATPAVPPALQDVGPDRLVDLDVRDDLRSGREPFSRIMAAKGGLRPGDVLRLRAIFEPVPLYDVMSRQGLTHWTERLASDDWRVWFYDADQYQVDHGEAAGEPGPRIGTAGACRGGCGHGPDSEVAEPDGGIAVLDVRGLEPPEPMVRTLAALDDLPPGGTLVQLNVRVPQFLLPQLEERGFEWEVREQSEDLVRLFIRRREQA